MNGKEESPNGAGKGFAAKSGDPLGKPVRQ
jgi:hypothetical protein